MNLKDIIFTANANMFRSKLRTTLTILAIFIGAFTLTLTTGIGSGISSYVDKQVNSLGQADILSITTKPSESNGANSDNPQEYKPGKVAGKSFGGGAGFAPGVITKKDIAAIKSDKSLTDVQPLYMISPDYIQGASDKKLVISSSPAGESIKPDLATGSGLDNSSAKNQLILPINYVSSLGFNNSQDAVNKQVTLAVSDAFGTQHTVTATIRGIQQKGLISSSGALFNHALTTTMYDLQSRGLPPAAKDQYILVTARIVGDLSDSNVDSIKSHLDSLGYKAQTAKDQLGSFKAIVNALTSILSAFAIIALFAASFGIVNTLLMSVQERTKEIGLMKAMGMRSSRIFLLFSIEAILIGFWGSAIGVGAGIAAGMVANNITANGILKDLPGFNLLAFPATSIIGIMVLIMVIAFLAGTLPARKAAKQNPIDALRYE